MTTASQATRQAPADEAGADLGLPDIPPGEFTALVVATAGELKDAARDHLVALTAVPRRRDPGVFAGVPWIGARIGVKGAAGLLGVTELSMREYARRGEAAHRRGEVTAKDLPLRDPAGPWKDTWLAGDVVFWEAVRQSQALKRKRGWTRRDWPELETWARAAVARHQAGGPRTSKRLFAAEWNAHPGHDPVNYDTALEALHRAGHAGKPSDEELLPHVRKLLRRGGPAPTGVMVKADLAAKNFHISDRRALRLLAEAAGERLLAMRWELETPDGLVSVPTVADALGVGRSALTLAIKAGRLRAVRRQVGNRTMVYLDPARLRIVPGYITPVDVDWHRPERHAG